MQSNHAINTSEKVTEMNEFERYPHLMSAALGLPPWAMHLRTLNNLNTLAAIGLAIFVAFSQSLGSGVAYAAIYIVGCLVVAGIGSNLAQRGSMLGNL
jgi:hypothetical protein